MNQQVTMGAEFATERNLEMALGDGRAKFPRLFDVAELKRQQESRDNRRAELERGQMDIFGG